MKQLIAGIVIAAAVIGGVFTVSHLKLIGTGKSVLFTITKMEYKIRYSHQAHILLHL